MSNVVNDSQNTLRAVIGAGKAAVRKTSAKQIEDFIRVQLGVSAVVVRISSVAPAL